MCPTHQPKGDSVSTEQAQTTSNDLPTHDTEYVLKTAMEAAFNVVTLAEAILTANKAGNTNLADDLAKMILLKMVDVGNDLDVHIGDLGLA